MARTFFPEVQALRALAVVLVVAYHLMPHAVPGGFIGVDVFFVISGYLITGRLLREHGRTGRVSLSRFWAARARRILPAAMVCIAVTVAAAYVVYPPTQWDRVGVQAIAASFSVLNWLLAAESVDYSAAAESATPFQHFWSLGVEEQFYVLWPVVVIVAGVLAARSRLRRHAFTLILGLVVLVSFVMSVVQVASGDPAVYFVTTGRVWELALGGALALWLPRWEGARSWRPALSLVGLVTIVLGALLIDGGDPFPGALALVPVLGAAAVIVAGRTSGFLSPDALYRARPVQWVGDVSYSLYLWHFPPIVLFTVATGASPDLVAALAIAAGALVAATLSHRFVERPFRAGRLAAVSPRRALVVGAASVVLVAVFAGTLPLAERRVEGEWVATAAALEQAGVSGAAGMTRDGTGFAADGLSGMIPAPSRVGEDEPSALEPGCTGVPRSPTTPTCAGGDPDGDVRVALVGDSHAKQFATAVFAIAKDRGWRVDTYVHASCPFNTERRQVEVDGGAICAQPNADTMTALLEDPYDIVITANWASGDFVDTETGQPPGVRGYAAAWNALADAGSDVVVIKDVPKPRSNPLAADCLAEHYDEPAACGMPRAEALEGRDIVDVASDLAPRAVVVDIIDRLCGTTTCPAVIGNVVVYRDSNHLTDTFVRTLTPYIAERIPQDLGRG